MNLKNLFILSISIYLFTGCSYKSMDENIDMSNSNKNSTNRNSALENNLNNELYDFYAQWEGVKYKLGGESKSGIDCSAFIQKAFKEKLDLAIPRTTTLQSKIGKEINKDELEAGDLVFFHTGRTNHVGIYMENGKFIHASTKSGVTMSDLDNSYFTKNYWKAQRIID